MLNQDSLKTMSILALQEFQEVIRSRLIYFLLLIYSLFCAFFIFVATKESSVLGFTGMGRVLFSISHGLVFILPLLALSASSQVLTQYKENGSVEFFMSHPISRMQWFFSIFLVRFLILSLPLIFFLIFFNIIGYFLLGENISWSMLLHFLFNGLGLIWCFLSIGFFISEQSDSQTKSIIAMLLVWFGGILILDFFVIGVLLNFNFSPVMLFILTTLNPIQAARIGILSVLEPELSILGPMGFFISTQINTFWMGFLGIAWPIALGNLFLYVSFKNIRNGDLL